MQLTQVIRNRPFSVSVALALVAAVVLILDWSAILGMGGLAGVPPDRMVAKNIEWGYSVTVRKNKVREHAQKCCPTPELLVIQEDDPDSPEQVTSSAVTAIVSKLG